MITCALSCLSQCSFRRSPRLSLLRYVKSYSPIYLFPSTHSIYPVSYVTFYYPFSACLSSWISFIYIVSFDSQAEGSFAKDWTRVYLRIYPFILLSIRLHYPFALSIFLVPFPCRLLRPSLLM